MPTRSFEECASEAQKYNRRSDFCRGSKAEYAWLHRRGLLDSACGHMQISPKFSYVRWNHAAVFDEAQKYTTRAEFKRRMPGAYEYALSNRMLDQACAHMRDGHRFWHVFELMAVAVKYQDWSEFIRAEPQAYNFANKNKLISMASAHMGRHCVSWTKELVMAEATKFTTKSEFFKKVPGAYKHAEKYGYYDEVAAHMEVRKRNFDKDAVLAIAAQFQTRTEFQRKDGGAYAYARMNGYLDEACAHMVAGPTGFCCDKPSVLYHIRITLADGAELYKIGITNRDPEARVVGMGLFADVKAEVLDAIKFDRGRDARMAEKRLHRRLARFRYHGQPVMKNGNTELFTVNVFETYEWGCHAESYLQIAQCQRVDRWHQVRPD